MIRHYYSGMVFWVYILRCSDGLYYTGHTVDLERRMAEHHDGLLGGFTARRRPVELIWCDNVPTRYEAISAEFRIKKWSRAKKEALAAGDWRRVGYFAKPPHKRVSTTLDTNGLQATDRPPNWVAVGRQDAGR